MGYKSQGAAVSERDFFGPPIRALVEALGLCAGGVPFLVEPVQVRFVIGDPFLDGLPGWLDGLHGVDVEGWWQAWKTNNSFPEAVEAEEEFDFALAQDLADGFHGVLAAGALKGYTWGQAQFFTLLGATPFFHTPCGMAVLNFVWTCFFFYALS